MDLKDVDPRARQQQATGGQRLRGNGQALAGMLSGGGGAMPGMPRGDAENFVHQGPIPQAPSASPGYAFPASEEYTQGGDYGPTLGGRLEQLARLPRPERPETGASVRDRLNNIDRAVEVLGEASIQDSSAQWTAMQQMYGDLRAEIQRIKMFLGIS